MNMKKEIKKIIITLDNNQLTKVIVVYDKAIKRYDNSKFDANELLNIYSNNVRILKELYKDELEGLSKQEGIDKLVSLGKIQNLKKNLITNIKIFNENTDLERIVIEYENGFEIIKRNDFLDYLEYQSKKQEKILELCTDYDLEYNELSNLGLLTNDSNIKKSKIENLIIRNKRLLAVILTGAITLGIGVGIVKLSKNNNDDEEDINDSDVILELNTNTFDVSNNKTIEPKPSITPISTINNTKTVEPKPTPTSIEFDNIPEMSIVTIPPKVRTLDDENKSNKKYILENYKSNTNPFRKRFSQGSNGYGNVKFEGKTIKNSGCGICAFASGVSCALTLEYDTNVLVNPKELLKELKSLPQRHYYRGDNGLNWGATFSYISEDITEAFQDISIIELENCTPTFNTETLQMITNKYPVVVSLNGRKHIVCVSNNNGNGKFYVLDSDRGYSSPVSIKNYIVRSDGKRKGTISGKKGWILIPNKNIKIHENELQIDGLDLLKLPTIGSFQTNGNSYEVTINEYNNSLVINTYDKEESVGIKK